MLTPPFVAMMLELTRRGYTHEEVRFGTPVSRVLFPESAHAPQPVYCVYCFHVATRAKIVIDKYHTESDGMAALAKKARIYVVARYKPARDARMRVRLLTLLAMSRRYLYLPPEIAAVVAEFVL
jgi:hypothetical protein